MFTFDICLGGELVKRVTFNTGTGKRELRTSGGESIGVVTVTANGLRIDLDEDAAQLLVQGQF